MNFNKKIWAQYLGTHINSMVQKYILDPCFNLFILHNNSFDNQGSEINKSNTFLRFNIYIYIYIYNVYIYIYLYNVYINIHIQNKKQTSFNVERYK